MNEQTETQTHAEASKSAVEPVVKGPVPSKPDDCRSLDCGGMLIRVELAGGEKGWMQACSKPDCDYTAKAL